MAILRSLWSLTITLTFCRLENTWHELHFFLIYHYIFFFISIWNAKATSLSVCWEDIVLSFQRLHCIMHITHRICLIYISFANQCFQSALIHVHTVGINTKLGNSDFQHCSFTDIIQISNSNSVTKLFRTISAHLSLPRKKTKPKSRKQQTPNQTPLVFFSFPQCLFI